MTQVTSDRSDCRFQYLPLDDAIGNRSRFFYLSRFRVTIHQLAHFPGCPQRADRSVRFTDADRTSRWRLPRDINTKPRRVSNAVGDLQGERIMRRMKNWVAVVSLLSLMAVQLSAAEPVFLQPGMAVGRSSLDNTQRMNSVVLWSGSQYLDIAKISASGNNMSESTATIRFSNPAGVSAKSLEFSTKATALGGVKQGLTQLHTTAAGANTGPGFVAIQLRPSRSGEYNGKPVVVTLRANYFGRIINGKGRNFVQVAYHGGNLLNFTDFTTPSGGLSRSRTQSFNSTLGSTIRVGTTLQSLAERGASATGTLTLEVSVR